MQKMLIFGKVQNILFHLFYCISPKILLQYFNKLESDCNIAKYCNKKSIKQRTGNNYNYGNRGLC